jgi:hypothetical protein
MIVRLREKRLVTRAVGGGGGIGESSLGGCLVLGAMGACLGKVSPAAEPGPEPELGSRSHWESRSGRHPEGTSDQCRTSVHRRLSLAAGREIILLQVGTMGKRGVDHRRAGPVWLHPNQVDQ